MNSKAHFTLIRSCSHFLIEERDHSLPLVWLSFTVALVLRNGSEEERISLASRSHILTPNRHRPNWDGWEL